MNLNNTETTDERTDDVKSNAIVKYSAPLVPAPYTMLQTNTNLNLPPSNWLSNSVAAYGVPPRIVTRSGFSSFTMANKFPDCVGVVDVVSDAENIKKILKMHQSSSPISLLVHRVENTLLIDEFDVNKIFTASEGRWSWLRQFLESTMHSMQVKKEKMIGNKNMSRSALQQKSLVSKFLYHSLVPSPEVVAQVDTAKEEVETADPNVAIPLPFKGSEPPLPEPRLEEELPDPAFSHTFARNVVWNFEDIQMLVGTDIPIFGGGTHPCISLRLRDMTKPINVLTGMDYWLDNLMCNVPEVVMCYHLNGIVQKYELIKTEDLPHLPNSKFSTKVIRDIAQNILSFLKANATKSGHTYWLFKGRDDDVVKLYDLTSLCTDVLEEGQTPFTVPVAMLLYRVARNMKHHNAESQASVICKLLKNCVSLLPAEKYPEIVTSAHFMLADVYVPGDLDPAQPEFFEGSEQADPDYEEPSDGEDDYLAIRSLSLSSIREPQDDSVHASPPQATPLSTDVIIRCMDALNHVVRGVLCLTHVEPNEPEMASPSTTIPMSYENLKPDTKVSSNRKKKHKNSDTMVRKATAAQNAVLSKPTGETVQPEPWSWEEHLKTLLYDKAVLIYLTLIENAYSEEKYGEALRYSSMAMLVFRALAKLKRNQSVQSSVECSTYTRAGDALIMLVTRSSETMGLHDERYQSKLELDFDLENMLRRECGKDTKNLLLPPSLDSLEAILLASVACYLQASNIASDEDRRNNIQRRLGNVENEIGVYYLNQALATFQSDRYDKKVKEYIKLSQSHLSAGISAFQKVEDSANLALLYSNTGKLMRLRAHIQGEANSNIRELAQQERSFYKKAISNYEQALDCLSVRSANPNVWDPVYWELSTTYFTMASLLQDYPASSMNEEEAEREVIELLHKALKYCDLETSGTKLPIYELRCAKIHHRLASLHHRQFRACVDEGRKKHALQLSKLHYEKAAKLLLTLERTTEFFTVQMERIGLCESLADGSTKATVKNRHFTQALEHMIECCSILNHISSSEHLDDHISESDRTEQLKVLNLMLQRLQFILLSLMKSSLKKSAEHKPSQSGDTFKMLYSIALKASSSTTEVISLAACLYDILMKISKELDIGDHTVKR